jgi:predicted RNase H-like HicB family nuclease
MKYTIDLERDEGGWWMASVREVRGCRTQGRSIRQALSRIRQALAACTGHDVADAELLPQVHLPETARRAVGRYDSACKKLEREQEESRAAATAAADVLTRQLGLSVRDAADVLGLSHQRVHQLVRGR